ncbi:RNA polymerase sigma-70 factor, ECF subfamily [Acetitomaculum ruminis DSM 5522]|uniref:RNA polymerase sigma-70 factor, ECF subfamily n=1 Tax=Acetitomaculum ruminis DSM 5522 TaxID=1120918 RepID=A0A1I0YQ25_9FIRM|nr:RNA polymerase sigma factor [Acetitomaculum ruminis]SFB15479.1 RNA polymerase sigma-70 factor, ECF subfamily [Acetitomaculum ruminis DSM 5522]
MNRVELEQFMESYGSDILSFCKYLTKNKEIAEDLCQDTFVKGFEMIDRIENESHAKNFFLSIAIKLWKNKKRKFAWRSRIFDQKIIPMSEYEMELTGIENTPEKEAIKSEEIQVIRNCVNKLPEKKRLVILLYYVEGLKEKEIANVLKLPLGTVKSRLHQAKKDLEVMLSKNQMFK